MELIDVKTMVSLAGGVVVTLWWFGGFKAARRWQDADLGNPRR